MRRVLSFSLTAVFLVALLLLGQKLTPATQVPAATKPLSILVGSLGHMLPFAPLPGSSDRFDDAIAVGDLILTDARQQPGLRVAVLLPGLEFRSFHTIRTATDPDASEKLAEVIDFLPTGSVVIAAVRGRVRPPTEDTSALDEFPLTLGADFSPFRARAASWALISYKLDNGWQRVAESYSQAEAVHIAFTLSARPSDYNGYRAEPYYTEGEGAQTIDLFTFFEDANETSSGVFPNRWARAGAVRQASIMQRATRDAASSILWRDVTLGTNATFSTAFGLQNAEGSNSGTPQFSLYLDGELAASFVPNQANFSGWVPWEFDLQNAEPRLVDVELRTELISEGSSSTYNWGAPSFSWGVEE